MKEKNPIEKKKKIVYEVSCHDCQMKHIGETKRTMMQRMTEHRCTIKKIDMQNGIAVHVQ